MKIMSIYLDKSKVYTNLSSDKHSLYNWCVNILLDRIMSKKLISNQNNIEFVASRRETNKILNENFVNFLHNESKKSNFKINFHIKTPSQEK